MIQTSKDYFTVGIESGTPSKNEYLVLDHDIHYQTVYNLTAFMLTTLLRAGYTPVTIGECLGDPVENWYRDAPSSQLSSSDPVKASGISIMASASGTSAKASATSKSGSNSITVAFSYMFSCLCASLSTTILLSQA
jgi:hypothetical protein